MPRSHTQGDHRGLAAAADGAYGRFGRMFEGLEGPEFDRRKLAKLAASMIKQDPGQFFNEGDSDENTRLPAGYTYFSQFVDHDLTLDKTSVGEQENDPSAVENFRTAALDLDNVYGTGPGGDLVMYDEQFGLDATGKLVGEGVPRGDAPLTMRDHRRDGRGTALIGDPRNDENVIVAQMHEVFVTFHNRILDNARLMNGLEPEKHDDHKSERFRRAARLARWHYQWIIVNDFLKRVTHPEIYKDIVNPGGAPRLRLYPKSPDVAQYPYMPIEFAAAAYRFGHSMVRPSYALNAFVGTNRPKKFDEFTPRRIPIFKDGAGELEDLRGFREIPDFWGIDWGYFFEYGDRSAGGKPDDFVGETMQPAYRIDSLLVDPLSNLVNPDLIDAPPPGRSLPFLNLLRGSRLRLPTAEQVSEAMGLDDFPAARFRFLTPSEIWSFGSKNAASPPGSSMADEAMVEARSALADDFEGHTPLWFYVLREAEWYGVWSPGDEQSGKPVSEWGEADELGGHYLGPIGSTIVLETFMGLLLADPNSYLHQAGWLPMSPIAGEGAAFDPMGFKLEDLIAWALEDNATPPSESDPLSV